MDKTLDCLLVWKNEIMVEFLKELNINQNHLWMRPQKTKNRNVTNSVANPQRGQVSSYEAISIQIVSRFFTEYLDRYLDIKN